MARDITVNPPPGYYARAVKTGRGKWETFTYPQYKTAQECIDGIATIKEQGETREQRPVFVTCSIRGLYPLEAEY